MNQKLLEEAQNPQTTPERLQELSKQEDLCRAITQNPNAPLDLLVQLAPNYPKEFVENPALELFLLEQPEALRKLTPKAIQNIVAIMQLPLHWCTILAGSPTEIIQQSVVKQPHLTESILVELAGSQFAQVRLSALAHPSCSLPVLERSARTFSAQVLLAVANHPKVTPALLGNLMECEHRNVRKLAAQHPQAPADILQRLRRAGASQWLESEETPTEEMSEEEIDALSRRGVFARRLAAGHPRASLATQKRLFRSEDLEVRGCLAGSSTAPVELLEALAQDRTPHVRARVAKNPRTPQRVLTSFSLQKEDGYVKDALVHNPNTPREVFFTLIENPPSLYRNFLQNICRNPSVPVEILLRFAFASSAELRSVAANNPSFPQEFRDIFTKAGSPDLMRFVPGHHPPLTATETQFLLRGYWGKFLLLQDPTLPLEILQQIVFLPELEERFESSLSHQTYRNFSLASMVAEHPNTDSDLLHLLWEKSRKKSRVEAAIARNPKTAPQDLQKIIQASAHYVGKELAQNPSLTEPMRRDLFLISLPGVQHELLSSAQAETSLLFIAMCSSDASVRQTAAQHPNTPKHLLSLLRRAGAGPDLSWFQAPDLTLTEEDLRALTSETNGEYLCELLIRHPSCSIDFLKEIVFVSKPERAKPFSFRLSHALASRATLPVFLLALSQEKIIQEAIQLFQKEIPLPVVPLLEKIRPIKLSNFQERNQDYFVNSIKVKPGQQIKVDDILCEIDTDVLTLDYPSTESGTVCQILTKEGETIRQGDSLFLVANQLPGVGEAPPLWIQRRQNMLAAWYKVTLQQEISTQFFIHQPTLDTPRYTAFFIHEAFSASPRRFWTDGHEIIYGENVAEKLFQKEHLWENAKNLSAQQVARIWCATHPEKFGVPICTPKEPRLHPPLLVREPQGPRWVFWSQCRGEQICWFLWEEGGMMHHRALFHSTSQ